MKALSVSGCRVFIYLLTHQNQLIEQKQIAEKMELSRGQVSKIIKELRKGGIVHKPYKNRVVLDSPHQLILQWISNRAIRDEEAYFFPNKKILSKIDNVHTLFSGAWLDVGWLKTRFTTVYTKPGFKCNMPKGKVGDLKDKVILIVPKNDYVFYGVRKIKGEKVVNPYQLYVDLASFLGLAQSTLEPIAEKYKLPKIVS
jgi:transcriptional regulator with XRE-family HTH domain